MTDNEVRRHVATEVKVEMLRHGYTQRSLARALGVSISALNPKLTGARAFDIDELSHLAELFDVPVHRFLPGTPAEV